MPSTDVWTCSSKEELLRFHVGIRDGTVYETIMFIFAAVPNSLHLTDGLAKETLPYFRWFSDRRSKGVGVGIVNLARAFVGDPAAAVSFAGQTIGEVTSGTSQKLSKAEELISDPELRKAVISIFDHGYLLGRVLDSPPTISFYRDDGRF